MAEYTDAWRDSSGGYDTSFRTAKSVAVDVRNLSRETQALTVRCVFFGMQPAANTRTIFGTFSEDFTLGPSRDFKIVVDSPTAHGRDENYSLLGSRYLTGTRYEGWLVQLVLKSDGRIIKQIGSRQIFEELSGKPEFAQMQKAYEGKLK